MQVKELADVHYPEAEKITVGDGQPEHPSDVMSVRGVRARRSATVDRTVRNRPYAQARIVAQHGRMRTERVGETGVR